MNIRKYKKYYYPTFLCLTVLSSLLLFAKNESASCPEAEAANQPILVASHRNQVTYTETDSSEEQSQPILEEVLLDVPLFNQMDSPQLYNGCEVTSLSMILNYHGFPITKNQLADRLESVPIQDAEGYYGNPNRAFVGDMTASTGPGYFVYHEPIFNLAQEFISEDFEMEDLTGDSFEELQRNLSAGSPIWVITTTTFSQTGDSTIWRTREGDVSISMSEHSVVLTGYDDNFVYLNDPYGRKDFATDRQNFIDSWIQMGSQAIAIREK